MKHPNEHLKEVEIVGFVGRTIDIELTVYLLKSAIKLETIVINPHAPHSVGNPHAPHSLILTIINISEWLCMPVNVYLYVEI